MRYSTRRNRRHMLAGIAILVLITALGCNSTKTQNGADTASLNTNGVQLATAGLVDDVLMAASGTGESVITQEQGLALATIDLVASAQTFETDYEANELAGDAKYKGKRFLLYGAVRSIEKDFTGSGFLTLASSNIVGVRAQLNERGMIGAMALTKGTKIFLVCRSSDRVVGTEVAGDCQRLSQYLDEIKPELNKTVQEFLAGKRPLPRSVGTLLPTLYVIGSHLQPESPCFTKVDAACEQELRHIGKDIPRTGSLDQEVRQIQAKLKLQ